MGLHARACCCMGLHAWACCCMGLHAWACCCMLDSACNPHATRMQMCMHHVRPPPPTATPRAHNTAHTQTKQARQQEITRLQQLADVLGMGPSEIAAVQQDLAEQAFRAQANEVLRGTGTLSPERQSYLEEMRKQLKLPQDKAEKVIREVRGLL